MDTKESERVLADDLAGFNLVPPVGQPFQPIEGQGGPFHFKQSAALETGERRSAFHLRSPPHQQVRILISQRLQGSRRALRHQQRHDRRSVPEFHRPSRRSSMSAPTADALELGGGVVKTVAGATVRRGRNTPSRMSRANRPLGPPSSPPATGSRRATGRPRSTIKTGSPPLRPSIRELKPFLAWVILALFITLK